MRVLFFNPEQYVDFADEPSNVQLRLPILNCGLVTAHHDHIYQRDLRAHGRPAMERRALDAVAAFRPDLVVYSATWEHENLAPATLAAIRDGGVPVVTMLWDSWIEPTTAEAGLLAASSVLVVADSVRTYLRCRLVGSRRQPPVKVAFAAGQVFTDLVRPLPDEAKLHDVTLLGSNEGSRAGLAAHLAEALPPLGIAFNKAGGLVDSRKGHFRRTDDWVSWPEYVRIINRSRLCLSTATDPTRLQIKGKIFDYMACGVACLTDLNPETSSFVPPDAVAVFSDPEDCVAQIRRLLGDDAERRRLAEAGRGWLTRTFGYAAFWRGVLRAAVGEDSEPPSLPALEEAYDRLRARQDWMLRRDLATAGRLATAAQERPGARRVLPVWLGRREGFHRLMMDDGTILACNRMPVDLLRDGPELVVMADAFGRVVLDGDPSAAAPDGVRRVEGAGGAVALHAADPDRLDAAIDRHVMDQGRRDPGRE